MKNKTKYIYIFFCIIFFNFSSSFSDEVFNFDVSEIEIKENGNKFIGKNGGTARSLDGTKITANNFDYDKLKNILKATGNVKIYNPKDSILIYTDKITYYKNNELIFSYGNSRALDEDVQIDADNFEYNKIKNILKATGNVKIDNKKDQYLIFSDNITYDRTIGKVSTKNNSRALDEDVQIDADNFEYNKIKNILKATGNVKIDNKKDQYLISSDNITYDRTIGKVSTKNNSKVVTEGITITSQILVYDEKQEIFIAKKNVKVDDKIENYELKSNYINYNKISNIIFTEGKTEVNIENKYEFLSSDVYLNRNKNELMSDRNTSIKDDDSNFYKLSKFLYFYEKKFLKGNDIEVYSQFEKDGSDKFFFKNAFINFSTNSFKSEKTKIDIHKEVFDEERELKNDQKNIFKGMNDPRIYAISSSGDKDYVVLNKAIFTSCQKNNNCPAWSIKANKIIHDKKKQNIIYENAILNLYDVPVFYFPKFFHPDPSVDRRSGLLQPRLNNSNVLGSSINIPYFHVISENKDITFKPTIFDNRIYMFQNEYRQENENSSFITDFSYIKGYKSKQSNNTFDSKNSISHIFSKFDLDLGLKNFASSKLKVFLEKVNNDTYLKVFENVLLVDKDKFEEDIKDKNNLTSGLELALDHKNFNLTTGFTVYENLQKRNNDRFQKVLPYYDISTTLHSDERGTLNFKTSGRNTLQNTNNLRSTVTNSLDYISSDLHTKNGFVNNFGLYFKNLNGTGKNDAKYKSNLQSELLNIYEVNTSLPLFKENLKVSEYIIPKISFRINPSDMKNYSSETRLITTDNIFDINRLGISDSYESGKSLTLGVDYRKENKNNIENYLEIKFAGVLRDSKENKIPVSSSINRTASNLFGSVENSFSEFFSINYDFSVDNDFSKFQHNAIETEFSINNFVTSFNFVEKDGEIGSVNTLENTTKISFDNQNSLLFKTRRNRKISLTEYYDLVYEYQNDCLTAGIKYRKTYYQDRDLRPKEDLFFTITLFPITSLDQKIDQSLYSN